MANLYDYQSSNIHRTWVMFVIFFVVVIAIGYVFSQVYGDPSFIILAGLISLVADVVLRSLCGGGGGFGGRGRAGRNDEAGEMFFILAIVLSILAPIGTMLIQLAISRRREALADASGVLLTRYPEG